MGGQQINFDPFGKLVYQETVIGGLCQGLGGALKNRATSLAQLQQLSLADSNVSVRPRLFLLCLGPFTLVRSNRVKERLYAQ